MSWVRHLRQAARRPERLADGVAVLAILAALLALRPLDPALATPILTAAAAGVALGCGWRWGVGFVLVLAWAGGGVLSLAGLVGVALAHAIRVLAADAEAQGAALAAQAGQHAQAQRELQHRIANTLQYISNMLQLSQIEIDRGAPVAGVFERAFALLAAMGQLHRQARDGAGLEKVIRATLEEVFESGRVTLRLDIAPLPLPAEQMTALVLLVTEAAVEAEIGVFRPAGGGVFAVRLAAPAEGGARLSIDDGQPAAARTGMAARVMQGLVRQLGGRMSAEGGLVVDFRPG